jgi:hypothetical protein
MQQKIKRVIKVLVFWLVIIVALGGVVQYFRWAYPQIETREVKVYVNQEVNYPVLERIAQCESGGSQFDKNGQVLMRGNTNGRDSVDVGLFQVNLKYHGAEATKMGLDLTKEADNRAYAKFLYQTRGTVDWEASKHCWNK